MSKKHYEFHAVIEGVPDKGGAYIRFPYNIREEFGKGRVKVDVTFDGEPYCGSIVNMGVKNTDGSVGVILLNQEKRKVPVAIRMNGYLCQLELPEETLSTVMIHL